MSPMNLHDLQLAFSDALFNARDTQAHSFIEGTSAGAKDKRLDIYRNNVFYSLTNALADLYPVIKRLVGDEFFNATASEYIHQRPPRSAAMVNFGGDFPEFLQEFEHTAGLSYLVDVAGVELAWHQAYHAEDVAALAPADFSAVRPEDLNVAKLVLHPSVRLLQSSFPVLQIWNANQEDKPSDELIDLDSGGIALCIYRPGYDVYVREIDSATYTLLRALQHYESLESAMSKAGQIESMSSIPGKLAFCIQEGLFTNFFGS